MAINFTDPGTLLLIFAVGITIKSFYAIRSWKDFGWWAFAWFAGFYGAARINEHRSYSLEQMLLDVLLFFAFFIAILLHKNILPRLKEHSLLALNLIFLYGFIKYILFSYQNMQYALIALLIPTIFIIYISFVKQALSPYLKLFVYIWFILLNLFFIVFYLFSNEISLLDYSKIHFVSPLDAFFTGFTAFSLATNFGFIYMFVFPGDKGDSLQERIRKWKEYSNEMLLKYEDTHIRFYQALIISFIAGGALILNYFLNFASDGVFIPTYLFLSQVLLPVIPAVINSGKSQIE